MKTLFVFIVAFFVFINFSFAQSPSDSIKKILDKTEFFYDSYMLDHHKNVFFGEGTGQIFYYFIPLKILPKNNENFFYFLPIDSDRNFERGVVFYLGSNMKEVKIFEKECFFEVHHGLRIDFIFFDENKKNPEIIKKIYSKLFR